MEAATQIHHAEHDHTMPAPGQAPKTAPARGPHADAVPGLAVTANGLTLELERTTLPRGHESSLGFRIVDDTGETVRDFQVEHDRRMHLIVVRRDLTGFQHLHPRMDRSGVWGAQLALPDAGSYRVFADFSRDGAGTTLAADLNVDGDVRWEALPEPAELASAAAGYGVSLEDGQARAGEASELAFTVTREGEPIQVEPYLGANGHLVALREGDLAFLHVHPEHDDGGTDDAIRFMTAYPSAGRYRLFLQFQHAGKVHTAAFTREVSPRAAAEPRS